MTNYSWKLEPGKEVSPEELSNYLLDEETYLDSFRRKYQNLLCLQNLRVPWGV